MINPLSAAIPILFLLAACGGDEPPAAAPPAPDNQLDLQASIKKSAEQMQRHLLSGNLDEWVRYVHPDVIEMAGGEETLKERFAPTIPGLVETLEKSTITHISDVVQDGDHLSAFMTVASVYKIPPKVAPAGNGGSFPTKTLQTTYHIASSTDGGKSWTFLYGQGRKDQEEFFRKKFPALTAKHPFPECSQAPFED